MIQSKRLRMLILGACMLAFSSCMNTPLQRIQYALDSDPERFISGYWVGQFEVDDPSRVRKLGNSINPADRDIYQQLVRYQSEPRWFRFYQNGQVQFFDRRQYTGNWRVAAIQGRTAVVNISGGATYTDQKPLVFLGEDTLIVRPRLNGSPYARYGRIVYRRYAAPESIAQASSDS